MLRIVSLLPKITTTVLVIIVDNKSSLRRLRVMVIYTRSIQSLGVRWLTKVHLTFNLIIQKAPLDANLSAVCLKLFSWSNPALVVLLMTHNCIFRRGKEILIFQAARGNEIILLLLVAVTGAQHHLACLITEYLQLLMCWVFANIFHLWEKDMLCVIEILGRLWAIADSSLHMGSDVVPRLLIWIATTSISLCCQLVFIQQKGTWLPVGSLVVIGQSTHRFILIFLGEQIWSIFSRCHGSLLTYSYSEITFTSLFLILCQIALLIPSLSCRILKVHLHHTLWHCSVFQLLCIGQISMLLPRHEITLMIILSI